MCNLNNNGVESAAGDYNEKQAIYVPTMMQIYLITDKWKTCLMTNVSEFFTPNNSKWKIFQRSHEHTSFKESFHQPTGGERESPAAHDSDT